MSSKTVAQAPGLTGPGAPGGSPGQQGAPWWRVTWSVPAAMRAVRATIVIPCLFLLTFKVIDNSQMTLFAVFGSFATIVVTTFGGSRRDKGIAHLGLALAGSAAITIGTLASGTAWLAASPLLVGEKILNLRRERNRDPGGSELGRIRSTAD